MQICNKRSSDESASACAGPEFEALRSAGVLSDHIAPPPMHDRDVAHEGYWAGVPQKPDFDLNTYRYVRSGCIPGFHLTAMVSKGSNSYDPSSGTEAEPKSKTYSNPVAEWPLPRARMRGNYLENFLT